MQDLNLRYLKESTYVFKTYDINHSTNYRSKASIHLNYAYTLKRIRTFIINFVIWCFVQLNYKSAVNQKKKNFYLLRNREVEVCDWMPRVVANPVIGCQRNENNKSKKNCGG